MNEVIGSELLNGFPLKECKQIKQQWIDLTMAAACIETELVRMPRKEQVESFSKSFTKYIPMIFSTYDTKLPRSLTTKTMIISLNKPKVAYKLFVGNVKKKCMNDLSTEYCK